LVILTLMKSYEERREEQRKYDNDVFYEVWRNGGNPDRIDFDRVQDRYYNGQDVESAASSELQAQRPKPQEPSEEEYYEEIVCIKEKAKPSSLERNSARQNETKP